MVTKNIYQGVGKRKLRRKKELEFETKLRTVLT